METVRSALFFREGGGGPGSFLKHLLGLWRSLFGFSGVGFRVYGLGILGVGFQFQGLFRAWKGVAKTASGF